MNNNKSIIDFQSQLIAQIPVEIAPNNPPVQRYIHQSNQTDYLLGSAAVALVAVTGYLGLWLKKYFETRLEMSIDRQKQEFLDAKEDRDRAQNQLIEDRMRSQKQADIFLTTTLETIKEEKENNLVALNRVASILEKVDLNQTEMMHQIIELKSEIRGTGLTCENVQTTIDNLHSGGQAWTGSNRRSNPSEFG